jgi:PIN domain nuclease of toxin-antitoxin system
MIQGQQAANDLKSLPVALPPVSPLRQLPLHHHEPFERLLSVVPADTMLPATRQISAESANVPGCISR